MGIRESWSEMDGSTKVLVGIVAGFGALVVAVVLIVIIAAILGSFVLGVGDSVEEPRAPQTSFSIEYDHAMTGPIVVVRHEGGDAIAAERLTLEADDRPTKTWQDEDGTVTAGDEFGMNAPNGATVRLVWHGEEGTAVLARGQVPTPER
ncbi:MULTISPECIES: type IV pilin [unclassified Haloarcula]|uniref:type IV pilin n=1 Tax=Haloarcula TaxID=2237 RepID=UPI000EF1BB0B|nr:MULTISPECIES: type IV pilin [unclassified Haloarcula]RLM39733.1 type IV pilin [Haloarcula sp. Atlit-120R]RLM47707.1 type IV pilin [Haloarcula sp. Atlit-47R]